MPRKSTTKQTREETAAKLKEYYETHREELAAKQRARRQANREMIAVRNRAYQETHREAIAAQRASRRADANAKQRAYIAGRRVEMAMKTRAYTASHREEINAKQREYQKNNRDLFHSHAQKRRALKTAAGGSYTTKQWRAMCAWFGNVCLCCGAGGKLVADHVIPISASGSSYIRNIQPLCDMCNRRKMTKSTDYRDPDLLSAFLEAIERGCQ